MKIYVSVFNKKEKDFMKYMEIFKKVRNIIKSKFNSELIYCEKYLKTEKKKHKRKLSMCQ